MRIDVTRLLIRAVAPPHLADAIIGDLYERQTSLAQTFGETMRSLPALLFYRISQRVTDDWMVALPVAATICAICVITIPLWNHFGIGSGAYHALRLFLIGLILACIPRASMLGFVILLALIGISDAVIGARELYQALLVDALSMAAAFLVFGLARSLRSFMSRTRIAND